MTSKPFIMWGLNALGRSWAQAEPHLGLTPMGKAKGFFSSLGSQIRPCAGAAERTFLLESSSFETAVDGGLGIPSGSLKNLVLNSFITNHLLSFCC